MGVYMYVKNLLLKNFRNYDELNLSFVNGTNVVIGGQCSRENQVLEALYYASIGSLIEPIEIEN